MRKSVTLLLLAVICAQNPPRIEAGAFATEVTQLLNHAELVLQYIRQGEQLANELKMYADMVRNSQVLASQTFGAITADLNALATIVQGGQALAYSLSNLDALFRKTYPGYAYNAGAYYKQYRYWTQTSLDTIVGTLRAAGLQGQQLQSEQSILDALRTSLLSADGRNEALQALGDLSEQQVEQLMKLRELMLADMSAKQAYQAAMLQQQASSEAAAQQFFTYTPATSDGQTFGPGWH
jgi:type IV secretion system protein TrbJ